MPITIDENRCLGCPVSQRVIWQVGATKNDLVPELRKFDANRLVSEELSLPEISKLEAGASPSKENWEQSKKDADTLVRLFNIARAKKNFKLTVSAGEEGLSSLITYGPRLLGAGSAGGYNFYLNDQYGFLLMPGCNNFLACNGENAFLVQFHRDSQTIFKLIRVDLLTDTCLTVKFSSPLQSSDETPIREQRGLGAYEVPPFSFCNEEPDEYWLASEED